MPRDKNDKKIITNTLGWKAHLTIIPASSSCAAAVGSLIGTDLHIIKSALISPSTSTSSNEANMTSTTNMSWSRSAHDEIESSLYVFRATFVSRLDNGEVELILRSVYLKQSD